MFGFGAQFKNIVQKAFFNIFFLCKKKIFFAIFYKFSKFHYQLDNIIPVKINKFLPISAKLIKFLLIPGKPW